MIDVFKDCHDETPDRVTEIEWVTVKMNSAYENIVLRTTNAPENSDREGVRKIFELSVLHKCTFSRYLPENCA